MSEAKSSSSGRARRPGSTDVARLAGVSQKTVSRVLNGEPYVKEEVRLRVQAAMRELGYRRNDAARALNSGKTKRIGVVCLGTALFGPSTQLVAVERALRTTGYSVTIVNTLEGDTIADAVEHLLEQGVDGIILSEPIDEGDGVPIEADLPVLSFGRLPGLSAKPSLVTGGDNVGGGRTATEHLLGLGHRTVWHVAGPQRWWAAQDRLAGWRQALAAAGVPEPLHWKAIGCLLPATPPAASWPRIPTSQRSSSPTTTWPSEYCVRSPRPAVRSPGMSASSASTISRPRRS